MADALARIGEPLDTARWLAPKALEAARKAAPEGDPGRPEKPAPKAKPAAGG